MDAFLGPKLVSIGLAQDALVGVKHGLILLRSAQLCMTTPTWPKASTPRPEE